ncbi:hypothetical protein BV898_18898 [Hypsibius exemplaris]|uniref:BLOC-1-related complex subunit 8 n=1 Tax=Hypsibius exemplaris TaxID=2072580 RepID=A0A9X6RNL1_HYPEX|nr:hypothetical protein BV898_18898 [Hypsibius exemplaris]
MQAGGEFDPNFDRKVHKVADKLSENIHGILNEPSLGLYRIHEHVRKSMPLLCSKKLEASQQLNQLQGACYDMELTLNAAQGLLNSKSHFSTVHGLMKNSIFLAQHIQYERARNMNLDLQSRQRQTPNQARHGVASSLSVDIPDQRAMPDPATIKQSRTINNIPDAEANRARL